MGKLFDISTGVYYEGVMRVGRTIRRAAMIVLAMVILAAAVIFILINRIPSYYRPQHLSPAEQKLLAAGSVVRKNSQREIRGLVRMVGDFSNAGAGSGKPFKWSITEEEANLCLASIDAIASDTGNDGKAAYPMSELERAGFVAPAVAMRDGVLTLMVRSTEHEKILGADLAFVVDEQGDMQMEIRTMRMGSMPLPQMLIEERFQSLRNKLEDMLASGAAQAEGHIHGLARKDFARFMRAVVGMLDGEAVSPIIPWKLGADHLLRISQVEITPGRLTLHVEPAETPAKAANDRPPRGGG